MDSSKLVVFGRHDTATLEQIGRSIADERVVAGVLCADGHLGYANCPIGGVIAYDDHVSPSGVGFDIACGNMAVRLDADGDAIRRDIRRIMDEIWGTISFGIGRKNSEPVTASILEDPVWTDLEPARKLHDMAAGQLGTVGAGNHYVDLFLDEENRPWIGVHFGSRGLGHRLATHFIQAGGGKEGMNVDPVLFRVGSDLGEQYLKAMALAGRYAYTGRDWVCNRVASIVGAPIVETVHNHHNYAWKEYQPVLGREVWVVRKGATPAFPGQRGFVGGSMGDISVILEGIESSSSVNALHSTVHGSGRIISRTRAAGKRRWKKGARRSETAGEVDWEAWQRRLAGDGIELRGGAADEAPECYRRLEEVLLEHADTIRIVHRLTPIGVAMAGPDEYDPFKD
jgi:tRNA-splicing ligase RtcB (3'-phosphate/5'-hydroxy nucleic acid ligase)